MKHFLTLLQSNHYPKIFNKVGVLLKALITTACLYYIFLSVSAQDFHVGLLRFEFNTWMVLLACFVLAFLNWFLEAERWRISVPDEGLSFREALDAVLRGLALNWVVPFTLGDAGSRLLGVQYKKKAAYAMLINRSVMIGLTTAYGMLAVLFYYEKLTIWTGVTGSSAILLILLALLVILERRRSEEFSQRLLRRMLVLSFIRYVVFTTQFWLLINAFNSSLSAGLILLGVGWIFFFRSIVPSIVGNFGVREASAILFFQDYVDVENILLPCLLIWLINTVVPSLYGLSSVLKLKVKIA